MCVLKIWTTSRTITPWGANRCLFPTLMLWFLVHPLSAQTTSKPKTPFYLSAGTSLSLFRAINLSGNLPRPIIISGLPVYAECGFTLRRFQLGLCYHYQSVKHVTPIINSEVQFIQHAAGLRLAFTGASTTGFFGGMRSMYLMHNIEFVTPSPFGGSMNRLSTQVFAGYRREFLSNQIIAAELAVGRPFFFLMSYQWKLVP